MCFQYNQWVCIAPEGGAQSVPAEGAAAPAQGQVAVCVPPPARLLRGAVPREGPLPHRACHHVSTQILAKSAQSKRGKSQLAALMMGVFSVQLCSKSDKCL